MKKQIFLLLLIPLLCLTCKPNDQPSDDSEVGSIYVTVKRSNNLVSDATIITNPETDFFQTDFSGSTIIKDVNPETYQIVASHPIFGSGTETAIVKPGEITSIEITLNSGVFESPIVSFTSPPNESELDIDTPIEFSINVNDNNDSPQNISLEWSSSIDGLLSTQSADSDGMSSLFVDDLSQGDHIIRIKATDSDGFIGGDILNINVSDFPNSVFLNALQGLLSGIQLDWTTSDEPSFSNYKIYRSLNNSSNFNLVEIINEVNTTTFIDSDVSIGENYFYQIGVNFSNADERLSNVQQKIFQGVSIYLGTQVQKMIVDPNRPFIYAVDRFNNSLLFIDTDQGMLTKTIAVDSNPSDLDISLDGEKLYIANFGSTQIDVVDLNTQEIDFSFMVDPDVDFWGGNPYRITLLTDNRLAYTSEDQWNSIKIVDATTGVHIVVSDNIYQANLFTDLAGSVLYVGESGNTGSKVTKYDVSANTFNEVEQSTSGSAWDRNCFITKNGEFIFFKKQKLLASNLQSSLGSFSSEIFAANKDGSIALGEEQYYNGSNFSILGFLPIASKIMAADPNDDIFYIYNYATSSIVVFTP